MVWPKGFNRGVELGKFHYLTPSFTVIYRPIFGRILSLSAQFTVGGKVSV